MQTVMMTDINATNMEKEYNRGDIDFNAILGDFESFLEKRDYEQCNAVIDNVAELKDYPVALGMCRAMCRQQMKDRMTLPADYGDEKAFGVVESQMDVINKGLIF